MVAWPGSTEFVYAGPTAMTVIGAGTGRSYRFGSSGARLDVDVRDAASLAAVPNLHRVRGG